MAKRPSLRNDALALVPNGNGTAANHAVSQHFDGTIASACRYMDRGITTFIDYARAAEFTVPDLAQFLDAWDELDARAQREPSAADAICKRISLDPLVVVREVVQLAVETSALTSGLIAAVALPEVVDTGIRSALGREGIEDRRMLYQHSGFLPVPRGATVDIVNQVAATAIGANGNGKFYVPFEQDVLELESRERPTDSDVEH